MLKLMACMWAAVLLLPQLAGAQSRPNNSKANFQPVASRKSVAAAEQATIAIPAESGRKEAGAAEALRAVRYGSHDLRHQPAAVPRTPRPSLGVTVSQYPTQLARPMAMRLPMMGCCTISDASESAEIEVSSREK